VDEKENSSNKVGNILEVCKFFVKLIIKGGKKAPGKRKMGGWLRHK